MEVLEGVPAQTQSFALIVVNRAVAARAILPPGKSSQAREEILSETVGLALRGGCEGRAIVTLQVGV
jgi:hypothetical protein